MGTIFRAGLLCGVLDLAAALLVYRVPGGPMRLLQGIARGWMGNPAFLGGWSTAGLGVAFHFLVAFGAAAVYFGLSRLWPAILTRPIQAGSLFGIGVYFFMNLVVIPLSAIPHRTLTTNAVVIGLIIHIVCVGLPIALMTSNRLLRPPYTPSQAT